MTRAPTAAGTPIDLSDCDREPIHVPGAVQPHGALLAVTSPDLVVAQASINTGSVLGLAHEAVLGARLATILDCGAMAAVEQVARSPSIPRVHASRAEVRGHALQVIAHRASGMLIVELEPANHDAIVPAWSDRARDAIDHLQSGARLADVWPAMADVIRAITGFDRVMIYRFAPDGSGHVIAEARGEGVESFLDLWYPATDIPQQARALYLQNRIRLIVDAAYAPVPIVPAESPATRAPLDLSLSTLRSVSPVHCQYLANMGVRASMSVSLILHEQLWGLIACHHLTPRFIPYRPRALCAFIGEVASWMLGPKLASEESSARIQAAAVQTRLVERMAAEHHLAAALIAAGPSALDLVEAQGFAVVHEGAVTTAGVTPDLEQTKAIADWVRTSAASATFATDALASLYPPAAALQDTASGVLAAIVSRVNGMILLWFRPEMVREVRWAGDPNKPIDVEAGGLTPRRSFSLWKETVRGRSQAWRAWEIQAADDLRTVTAGVILEKAAELYRLNLDLAKALQSRDDLVSMASHELRTPTTTLKLQLAGIRRLADADQLTRAEALSRVAKTLRQVDRIDKLVHQLLEVSRIAAGRLDLNVAELDLAELAHEMPERYPDAPIVLGVEGDTVGVWDRDRLDQVFSNLLSNALKYGSGKPIDLTVRGEGDRVVITVRDRGIGISDEAKGRIFQRFERAVSPSNFPGFGLGLWIVCRVVEAHGGRIGVESAPGAGSTFTVDLPRGGPGR